MSKVTFSILFLTLNIIVNEVGFAQDNQSIELGEGSEQAAPNNNVGPATTVTIPLLHNYNNPNDNVFTDFFPLTSATISITNLYSYSQNTGTDNPSIVMGWEANPDGQSGGIVTGESVNIVVPFTALDESIDCFDDGIDLDCFNLYDISDMEEFYSSTIGTVGDGINFDANRGVFISAAFEGLRDAGLNYQDAGQGLRHAIGTITIEFNRPIDNPIIHLFGLGGFWEAETSEITGSDDTLADFKLINAGTVEFDFNSGASSSSISDFAVISSNADENPGGRGLVKDGNSIISNWNIPDVIDTFEGGTLDDSGVANGSVQFIGEAVETITLQIFARAVNSIEPFRELFELEDICDFDYCLAGTNEFGWGGGVNNFQFTDPDTDETWTFDIPEYNIAHDLFILSVSTDVDPDTITFDEGDSFRMLSSPLTKYTIDGEGEGSETDDESQRSFTYNELIGELWTQGGDPSNGYDTEFGAPNIFTWPLGVGYDENADPEDLSWQPVPDLNAQITPGHGFLMTVFEDDEFGVPGSFPKEFTFVGSEWPTPFTISEGDEDPEGWMLLGNPFKDPLNVANLLTQTTNTANVVYVWDRGTDDFPDKGWRWAGTDPGGNVLGEIDNGVLMPFQGFFIQKTDNTATVEFNETSRDVGAEGTFYRKELPNNSLRLFVEGESLGNSLWFTFSDLGSIDRLSNDALELESMSEHFALLSTTKSDGNLLTASHLPIPDEDFEIPVNVQTTRAGMYTISATDFNLSLTQDLYFIDLHEDVSVRIDQNFNYRFEVNQVAKTNSKPFREMMNGPKKANAEFGNRFLIATQPRDVESTLPQQVELRQNYPNPFNPTTQITYQLPQQADVRLTVYDMSGRQVATLVEGSVQAGSHTVQFDASNLASGVYMYRLRAGETMLSRKLTIIK